MPALLDCAFSPRVCSRYLGLGAGLVLALGACDPAAPAAPGNEDGAATAADMAAAGDLPKFSFFVTSLEMMRDLSKSQNGFGGDLRFGEATGIAGADKICTTIAERSMPGAGSKTWRAFLSASTGGANGGAVHAIERIGSGPWYDRIGRVVAMNVQGLSGTRPEGDAAITNDLPNETGTPNKQGVDNHDTLTGSNKQGRYSGSLGATCNDWTSVVGTAGKPAIGHSWPRQLGSTNGAHWISDHTAPGCAAGVTLSNGGGGGGSTVGGGGGYGGLYCFALTP